MLAELYVPAFRTLMCVRRLRGPEGVVVVTHFFLTQLSRGSISVGLHSQQSICQATLLIDIIHLPNLFHTSRFNQLLNPDRERYFLTRGYAKRRNGFLLALRYANVSLAHSGVESS